MALSIEEKTKAYDKISMAKKFYTPGSNNVNLKATLEMIFPELKENGDERMRKGIIRNLEYLANRAEGFVKDDLKEKIAWLKKQCEQKPAEWSEEDEDYINDLIKYFSQNERLKNTKEDIVIWLKSLRPQKQWKPNKEQMEALWNVYEGGEKQSALASLYDDLKKL